MARIKVKGFAIVDWPSFHDEFERAFDFFDGYGRNRDAWLDCMTDLHGPGALSGLALPPGEPIEIELVGSENLNRLHPEIAAELRTLIDFANRRYSEMGDAVRITLFEA